MSRCQVLLARDALGSARHQLGVILGALELAAIWKQDERQAAGAERLGLEQGGQRIPIEVDPAVRNVVPPQEIPRRIDARGTAPTEDGGADAVHPAVIRRAALPASR
jgi:hypothetical protein